MTAGTTKTGNKGHYARTLGCARMVCFDCHTPLQGDEIGRCTKCKAKKEAGA